MVASMLLSDMGLKPYTNTSNHNEALKPLTRQRFDKVQERAKLRSSVSRWVSILFPELEKFPWANQIAGVLKAVLEATSKGRYKRDMAVKVRNATRSSIGPRMPSKFLELQHTIRLIQELDAEIAETETEIKSMMG